MAAKKHSPAFERLCEESRSRVREVSVHDAAREAQTAGVVLVDVREESEWAAGRASGAVHLGKGIIERDIEERVPDKGTRLLLYCGGGYRSALTADSLQRMGYTNVASVAGGWRAWNDAGLPVTRG